MTEEAINTWHTAARISARAPTTQSSAALGLFAHRPMGLLLTAASHSHGRGKARVATITLLAGTEAVHARTPTTSLPFRTRDRD